MPREGRQEGWRGNEEIDGERCTMNEGDNVKLVVETREIIGRTGLEEDGASGTHSPRCESPEDQIKQNNSHVEAQVLLLLKEVVQDVLPDKVRIQRVVYHLCSPKLEQYQKKRNRKKTEEEEVSPEL